MKVGESFDRPESSLLIIDMYMEKIAYKMMTNPRLLGLLHSRTSDDL